MTRLRSVLSLAAASALVLATGACATDTKTTESGVKVIEDGKLTVCTSLPYEPFEFKKGNDIVGFDMDLMKKVADANKLTLSVIVTGFEGIQSGQALNSGILKRYHEEQIWSDRIRRQSTWGTWGLMGVNVLLFLVLQFVAEPWKRNRLMKGIAAEEKAALEAVRMELEDVKGALVKREEEAAAAAAAAAAANYPIVNMVLPNNNI